MKIKVFETTQYIRIVSKIPNLNPNIYIWENDVCVNFIYNRFCFILNWLLKIQNDCIIKKLIIFNEYFMIIYIILLKYL